MKRLIRFYEYCGRMGELSGQFVADDDEWVRLQKIIADGTTVYFGDVLGKHSDVCGPISEKSVSIVTDDQGWLDKADELGIDLDVGLNPLNYVDED